MILSTSKLNAKQHLMNENVIKGGLLTLWFTFEELISIIVVQRLIEVYTERDDDKMKMEMSVKERELFEDGKQFEKFELGRMLEIITGFEWQRQVFVCDGKYKLDFLLGVYLIVEYDREHESVEQVEKREKEIVEWFKNEIIHEDWNIPVIHVKRGKELECVAEVINHLVGYGYLSSWNNEARRDDMELLSSYFLYTDMSNTTSQDFKG